jgi:hypothetical protein
MGARAIPAAKLLAVAQGLATAAASLPRRRREHAERSLGAARAAQATDASPAAAREDCGWLPPALAAAPAAASRPAAAPADWLPAALRGRNGAASPAAHVLRVAAAPANGEVP